MIAEHEIEDASKEQLVDWCTAQQMTVSKSWPRPRLLEAALARRVSLRHEREVDLRATGAKTESTQQGKQRKIMESHGGDQSEGRNGNSPRRGSNPEISPSALQ